MELKRVGVMSAGKVSGALGVIGGLIAGVFMAIFAIGGAATQMQNAQNAEASPVPAIAIAVGTLIFAPVFYGICGFIGGILYAAIYNLVAGVVGGIEFDLQPRQP